MDYDDQDKTFSNPIFLLVTYTSKCSECKQFSASFSFCATLKAFVDTKINQSPLLLVVTSENMRDSLTYVGYLFRSRLIFLSV